MERQLAEILTKRASVVYPGVAGGEVVALEGVDLWVRNAEFITVIGSNGSGKSTLLKAISGTVSLAAGSIWVGEDNVTLEPAFRRAGEIAVVTQNTVDSVAVNLTVLENLLLALLKRRRRLSIFRRPSRSDRAELSDRVRDLAPGISDLLTRRASELSGGQRQMLALLMGVIQQPTVLLLDEHTAALDPFNRDRVNAATVSIVEGQSLTTMMTSHRLEDAVELGDRLIVLHEGHVVREIEREEMNRTSLTEIKEMFAELRGVGLSSPPAAAARQCETTGAMVNDNSSVGLEEAWDERRNRLAARRQYSTESGDDSC